MKVKTLLKYLEPYKETDIYFSKEGIGYVFFDNCELETDNKKILLFPIGKEVSCRKMGLNPQIKIT